MWITCPYLLWVKPSSLVKLGASISFMYKTAFQDLAKSYDVLVLWRKRHPSAIVNMNSLSLKGISFSANILYLPIPGGLCYMLQSLTPCEIIFTENENQDTKTHKPMIVNLTIGLWENLVKYQCQLSIGCVRYSVGRAIIEHHLFCNIIWKDITITCIMLHTGWTLAECLPPCYRIHPNRKVIEPPDSRRHGDSVLYEPFVDLTRASIGLC